MRSARELIVAMVVMPGLVPGIHAVALHVSFRTQTPRVCQRLHYIWKPSARAAAWMAGTSPAMTNRRLLKTKRRVLRLFERKWVSEIGDYAADTPKPTPSPKPSPSPSPSPTVPPYTSPPLAVPLASPLEAPTP